MRYAIVSDIHANLQAWNAVLIDIRSSDVDKIVCLGDLIGYGPNPEQVLESVYTSIDNFVLGNHDAVFCNKLDDSLFNDSARRIIDWTRRQLGGAAVDFLKELPLTLEGRGFRCAHGDLANPAYFNYVIEPEDAKASWHAVEEQLLFIGHTHQPILFLLGESGIPRSVETQDFALEEKKRYLLNVGSVGQPRDGDARASYYIFDQDAGELFWRRIPFDIDAYRSAIRSANIPESASYFLSRDPRAAVPPLREITSFSPAVTPDMAAKNVVEVRSIETLQKRVKKWRRLFAALAGLLTLLVIGTSLLWMRHAGRKLKLTHPQAESPINAADSEPESNLVSLPDSSVAKGHQVPGWAISLDDKYRQSVQLQLLHGKTPCLVLSSETDSGEIVVSSRPLTVQPGTKFCMEGFFKREPDFRGNIALAIELTKQTDSGEDQTDDQLIRKPPTMQRKDGWIAAKHTFTLPAGSKSIRLQIRGKFAGIVRITDVSLVKKE